jgi:hypothetical protein
MAENQRPRAAAVGLDPDGTAYDLHSVVVEQESGPSRCTIYPRHLAHDARTTTWLSADLSVFDDLESMR